MYIALPTVPELSVCLRCQYRLSPKKSLLSPRQPIRRRSVRHFVSQGILRQEAALRDLNSIDNIQYNQEPSTRRHNEGPIIRYLPVRSNTSAQREARRHSLDVDVLGRPAEVIVLEQNERESYLRPISAEGPDTNPKESFSMSSSELIDAIDKERGIISVEQACENIEALRRSVQDEYGEMAGAVSKGIFDDLASKLRKGFRAKQLKVYTERTQKCYSSDPLDLQQEYSCHLYARSAWRAGETPISCPRAPKIPKHWKGKDPNSSMSGTSLRKRVKKDDLIEMIMRECWRLTPQEESSAQGEVDIRLLPTHFDLILNHRRNILRKTSESYGVKLEIFGPESIIRISSDIEACGDIVRLFKYMIDNIRHATTSLKAPKSPARTALFARIENLTSTVIRDSGELETQGSSAIKLDIYYLGPERADLDDALRMLTSAAKRESAQKRELIWGYTTKVNAIASYPIESGSGLPLEDRHIQWSRWLSPEIATNEDLIRSARVLRKRTARGNETVRRRAKFFLEEQVKKRNLYEVPTDIAPYWTPFLFSDTGAKIGQIVFPTTSVQTAEGLLRQTELESKNAGFEQYMANARREFLTTIPGLVDSLRKLNYESNHSEDLNITLSPTPPANSPPQLTDALPSLELQIGLSEYHQHATLGTSRLVVKDKEVDIILPGNVVDLRLSRRTLLCSKASDPAIQDFVSSSNLNIWGNERLTTPNNLSITIPGHAIRSTEHPYDSVYVQQGLQVDYIFTSLEHRSRITTAFGPDMHINYTVIEAGRAGGRREELSLNPAMLSLQPHSTRRRRNLDQSLWSAVELALKKIEGALQNAA